MALVFPLLQHSSSPSWPPVAQPVSFLLLTWVRGGRRVEGEAVEEVLLQGGPEEEVEDLNQMEEVAEVLQREV